MIYNLHIEGEKQAINKSKLFFHGYIKHNNSLQYHAQAAETISTLLQTQSLDKLFSEINGAFQFVYLKDNCLYFSIDHFGGYTLFYRKTDTGIEIYDNPMQYPHNSSFNDKALLSIVAAGFTLNDDTIFNDVKECQPGTLYKYDLGTGNLTNEVWFSYISTNSKSLDYDELDAIVAGLFPEVSEGTYTLSLSGGIDSRFLFGSILNKKVPFQAFSFGSDLNDDKHVAKKLASLYNIPHTSFDFTPEICRDYFNSKDLEFIIRHCTLGRSLPNETDLIPSYSLNPKEDIICKGYGGDFFNGRYVTPTVLKLRNFDDAVKYLFDKYFAQTCISGSSMQNILYPYLLNSVQAIYKQNHKDIISTVEQWNLLHNERKYIVNTLAFYKALDFKFYLPFYDRNLVTYLSHIKYSEKTDQNAYFTYLREHFFTGNLAQLKTTESLRNNFLSAHIPTTYASVISSLHSTLRNIDRKKIRKQFVNLSQKDYSDILMLFTHSNQTYPYLKQKIGYSFPEIYVVSKFLLDEGCLESAKHLKWLSSQAIAQMNINGISFCKFFLSSEFLMVLRSIET